MSSLKSTDKLDIRDGVIHFKMRQQDGQFVQMQYRDTQHNRMLVSWIQIHD